MPRFGRYDPPARHQQMLLRVTQEELGWIDALVQRLGLGSRYRLMRTALDHFWAHAPEADPGYQVPPGPGDSSLAGRAPGPRSSVAFRVSAAEYQNLLDTANRLGVPLGGRAEVVRRALDFWTEHDPAARAAVKAITAAGGPDADSAAGVGNSQTPAAESKGKPSGPTQ